MFLVVGVSVSTDLPVTYSEQLNEERKELVVTRTRDFLSCFLWPRILLWTEALHARACMAGKD